MRPPSASSGSGKTRSPEFEAFFGFDEPALLIFDKVAAAAAEAGAFDVRVTKSQIGFYRSHPFAALWRPAQYVRSDATAVLTVYLRHRDASLAWKEVAEPAPGRFSHHLELYGPKGVDAAVQAVLREAWREAG